MIMVLLGNLISFLGCLLMISSGFIKQKKRILTAQCVQFSLQALGHVVLGSTPGAISCCVGIARILAFTRMKVTPWLKLAFIALQALLTYLFGAQTLIEWIPLLAILAYTWFLDTEDVVLFKIVNIVGVAMWVVHDLHYLNYVSVAFDVGAIITTTIGMIAVLKDRRASAKD